MSMALSRREASETTPGSGGPGSGHPAEAHRLASLVRECSISGISRHVLALRLSELPEGRSRPHHLQLARDALMPLTGAVRAQVYDLPNNDVVVVWRGESPALRASMDALGLLFSDDPAFGVDPMALAILLTLPDDAELVLQIVDESLRPRLPPPPPRGPGVPLDPPTLRALERAIAQADMSRFARREPVCRVGAEGFRLAWERRFLSDAELFETILPDRAPRADPWLFRRLTRTLDRRMLSLLSAAEELRGVPAFSVDLNVASLLGPEFLRFDANLPSALRGHVVINLRPEDILMDLPTFCFARDFVRTRGYRLLLHDITGAQLGLLPPGPLGFDLVQLRYEAMLAGLPDAVLGEPELIVLGGADTTAAINWGRARGVGYFQGRMANPASRTR